MGLRNRIVGHRVMRAGDLIPHHLNHRTHGDGQRSALRAVLEEIGLSRSVLAYIADKDKHLGGDAPLTLIDGHLRREELPDEEVQVEILDVNDAEARALLLSIDPLASLAGVDQDALDKLRAVTKTEHDALHNLWSSIDSACRIADRNLTHAKAGSAKSEKPTPEESFCILITCSDERHQVDLLRSLKKQGLECKALTS